MGVTAGLLSGIAPWTEKGVWDAAAEPPLRARALLLALVVSAHGLGVALALRMQAMPEIIPPGILHVQWISGGASGPPGPSSGGPQDAPAPPPPPPPPPPRPELPAPEPEATPEALVVPEALAKPDMPVAPPPPPEKKPRPVKRPKPPPTPTPEPVETPPAETASATASLSGVPGGEASGVAGGGASGAFHPGAGEDGGSDGGGGGGDYVGPGYKAAYLSNPKPLYPSVSRRMEEEGQVMLRVHITVDGRADEVLLHQGSGFERLDRAAMDAVRRWRFIPARRGRENVPAWVLVPIQFNLGS